MKRLAYILLLVLTASAPVQGNDILSRAEEQFCSGKYEDALALYRQADGAQASGGIVGASRTLVMTGRYEEAIALCREGLSQFPDNAPVRCQLAEALALTGRSTEAIEALQPVVQSSQLHVRSLVQYGKLLQLRGRKGEAYKWLQRAVQAYNAGMTPTAEDVAMAGEACRLLESFHDANTLFREATGMDPAYMEGHTLWGDLFREKFNHAEAQKSYQDVLTINEHYVPALVGLGTLINSGAVAADLVKTILEINSQNEPARLLLARLQIEDDRYEEAESLIRQALETNPESLDAYTLQAAAACLLEQPDVYNAARQKTLEINPGYGRFHAHVAEICGRKYRFQEAVEQARQAIAIDSLLWDGYQVLGMNLLRLGREAEGKAALEKSFEHDAFNFWTHNMLTVLDSLDMSETRVTEHFVGRMHREDAETVWPYLAPLLEKAWDSLSALYGFQPEGPILVEMFRDHEDFAVRTSGLPDIGPLVGVCFGRVITLDSPKVLLQNGHVNWQEIVWHEFAHVITLQMTRNRMPRWLSEGVSVFEEDRGRPEWGRKMDLDLVRAAREGTFFGLEALNSGFTKAESDEDLNMAYYQAALFVEYVFKQHGFETLKSLIHQYAAPRPMAAIFEAVFHRPLPTIEKDYFAWLQQRADAIAIYLPERKTDGEDTGKQEPGTEQKEKDPQTIISELRFQTRKHPDDFFAHLHLGIMLAKEGDPSAAVGHLQRAHAILPRYSGHPNPLQALANVYAQMGETALERATLDSLLSLNQHDFDACVKLADDALQQNRHDRAEYYLHRAIAVDPYDAGVHRKLAQSALARDKHEIAIREFRVLAALDRADPAGARTDLAEALLHSGDKAEAKRAALAALEIAPTYERAQIVLLKSLEP